jgi:Flp pilus assembly protein TadB
VTDASSSSDDFDRIVEGLDLDLTGLENFDASAARAAAARERAELEEEQRRTAEPADDQFYRQVGPAEFRARGRTRVAWLIFVGGPALLLIATMASVRIPPFVVALVVIGVVVSVVFLISQLPDRGPSNPDWPDDGAAL